MGKVTVEGFDYGALKKSNFVDRWQSLLEDNRHFLLDDFYNKEIYEMNRDVIEFNFKHLMETDWIEKAHQELGSLPPIIKENILKWFSGVDSRLC